MPLGMKESNWNYHDDFHALHSAFAPEDLRFHELREGLAHVFRGDLFLLVGELHHLHRFYIEDGKGADLPGSWTR